MKKVILLTSCLLLLNPDANAMNNSTSPNSNYYDLVEPWYITIGKTMVIPAATLLLGCGADCIKACFTRKCVETGVGNCMEKMCCGLYKYRPHMIKDYIPIEFDVQLQRMIIDFVIELENNSSITKINYNSDIKLFELESTYRKYTFKKIDGILDKKEPEHSIIIDVEKSLSATVHKPTVSDSQPVAAEVAKEATRINSAPDIIGQNNVQSPKIKLPDREREAYKTSIKKANKIISSFASSVEKKYEADFLKREYQDYYTNYNLNGKFLFRVEEKFDLGKKKYFHEKIIIEDEETNGDEDSTAFPSSLMQNSSPENYLYQNQGEESIQLYHPAAQKFPTPVRRASRSANDVLDLKH